MASSRATARQRPSTLSETELRTAQKRAAGVAAAELIEPGMRLGLGTGTTVAELLPAIAARRLKGLRCAATSPATARAAAELGLPVEELDGLGRLDLAIDGADQIDPQGWLVKGGGGAHTREKIVAVAAERFVVIASAEKAVAELAPPVPLELVPFGVEHTLAMLTPAHLRGVPVSPDGGLIADYLGPVGDPAALADRLSATTGLVEHGLFAPELVSLILIAGPDAVQRRAGGKGARPSDSSGRSSSR